MLDNKFKEIMHELENKDIRYYDDEINTPELKFIKAIVPYVDFKYRKEIACMIKIFELEMILNLYEKKEKKDEVLVKKDNFELGIINAMKTYLPADYFSLVKNIIMIFYGAKDLDIKKNLEGEKNNMEEILNAQEFKNLSKESKDIIKDFIRDIDGKTPIEVFNIIIEYNKKMPKDITDEQKDAIVNFLLKKMSLEKKQQFLDFYNMFKLMDKKS